MIKLLDILKELRVTPEHRKPKIYEAGQNRHGSTYYMIKELPEIWWIMDEKYWSTYPMMPQEYRDAISFFIEKNIEYEMEPGENYVLNVPFSELDFVQDEVIQEIRLQPEVKKLEVEWVDSENIRINDVSSHINWIMCTSADDEETNGQLRKGDCIYLPTASEMPQLEARLTALRVDYKIWNANDLDYLVVPREYLKLSSLDEIKLTPDEKIIGYLNWNPTLEKYQVIIPKIKNTTWYIREGTIWGKFYPPNIKKMENELDNLGIEYRINHDVNIIIFDANQIKLIEDE